LHDMLVFRYIYTYIGSRPNRGVIYMMRARNIIFFILTLTLFTGLNCDDNSNGNNGNILPLPLYSSNSGASEFQNVLEVARVASLSRSLSAAVYFGDGTELAGAANRKGDLFAVTSDMRFSIGSCTKMFIAAAIFELIRTEQLGMDDELSNLLYNPGILSNDFKDVIDPHIRVRDLLNHTSGIDDFLGDSYYLAVYANMAAVWDPVKTLGYVGDPYHVYDYTTRSNNVCHYSNTDYILLGMIIEHITGKNINTVVNEYFLTPLGLVKTCMAGVEPYLGLTEIPGPSATGFEKWIDENLVFYWSKSSDLISEDAISLYSSTWACGNMISTAHDMARWARYYYQYQKEHGYLTDDAFNPGDIASGYFTERKFGYGIEYLKHDSGAELWGHTGTIMGFNTLVFYWPEKDASIAILINDHRISRWDALHYIIEYIAEIK
jgi:D-alanyl-D-alanine carboxypeptidase